MSSWSENRAGPGWPRRAQLTIGRCGDVAASWTATRRSARWSRDAAALAVGGDGQTRHRLVIEHLAPMHRILRRLIDEQFEVVQVAKMLPEGLDVVVVTREQSSALTDDGTPAVRSP
jgi:hypothetical protein